MIPAPSLVMQCQRVFPVMIPIMSGGPLSVINFDLTDPLLLVEWLCGAAMDWPCLGYVGPCSHW